MESLAKYWRKFKGRPDIWFFYAFLATSTLSIRKVLFFYPIGGTFNEYSGAYLYLSDIFLFLTLLAWFLLLYNNNSFLSIYRNCSTCPKCRFSGFVSRKLSAFTNCSTWNNFGGFRGRRAWNNLKGKMTQNVPRGTFLFIQNTYQHIINNYLITFPLLLAFFSFLSILWATNKPITLFRSIKLSEFILMYFYIIQIVPRGTILNKVKGLFHARPAECSTWNNFAEMEHFAKQENQENCSTWNNLKDATYENVPRGTFFKNVFFVIIMIGFIQAIIGILQFLKQSSVGLFWLKESLVSPEILGVAKVIFDGQSYIRAYGLFPHPNIFGGFLVFSIVATLLYFKLFHVEQFERKSEHNCSTWNNLKEKVNINVPRGTFFLRVVLLIQGLALSLTFSKSAIIGLILGLFYMLLKGEQKIVPRGTILGNQNIMSENANCSTWNNFTNTISTLGYKLFHVEHFKRKLALVAGIAILLVVIAKPDIHSLLFKSLQERSFYLNVSRGTILSHPLLGVGSGQYIFDMADNYRLENWQYQPVHNVFLLLLSEFGILVLLLFLYFLYKLFHVEQFQRQAKPNCSTWNNLARNNDRQFENIPFGKNCSTWNNCGGELAEIVPPQQKCSTWNILRGRRGTISGNNDVTRAINVYFKAILVAFTFVMLFDHYPWDIQQGSLLLWSVLGICAASDIIYNEQ